VDQGYGGTQGCCVGYSYRVLNIGGGSWNIYFNDLNMPLVTVWGASSRNQPPVGVASPSMLTLCLTHDHRLTDGAPAATFLQHVAELLETPYFLGK
jgi:pyruvate dehydrogenase E2 component (dihydrolipoamide acetyltransferase)